MTKGVSLQDIIASGDETRVREKLVGLLKDVEDGMGMPITIYSVQLCAIELERQAAEKSPPRPRPWKNLPRYSFALRSFSRCSLFRSRGRVFAISSSKNCAVGGRPSNFTLKLVRPGFGPAA